GLAAALEAKKNGAKTIIIERENRVGGILKQCIHDGFGLVRFGEKLSGPEYAERYIKMVKENNIPIMTSTFASNVEKIDSGFKLSLVNDKGVLDIKSKTLVLANGCRERSSRQVNIHGTRPAGIYTAGTAQYFVNINGYLPCKKCVILGSGDIGLIMARRLTLEGTKVIGVFEAKSTPSGLSRNIVQCLNDYSIPLYLSQTVTKVFGQDRVEAVEISNVDKKMQPIKGTEKIIKCDGIILSVGLIPENEIAEVLKIKIDNSTKGPLVDNNFMTTQEGIFSCGNALHVNDLVDYVSESGKLAGKNAAIYSKEKINRTLIPINRSKEFLYVVPQYINVDNESDEIIIYFRAREVFKNKMVFVKCGDKVLFKKKYMNLKPPEMERIKINLDSLQLENSEIQIFMEEG
ncbi:MAG: FAD-dependent oxidoreductase, partial [Fusobacterium sp. JB020]|nr:FAD-dependent oxidoreductase [Fusobacterium sp. JB020]